MRSTKILARYVTLTTTLTMLGTTLVLAFLFILFSYVGELSNLSQDYGAWQALQYVLWDAPYNFNRILPISALIGAVLGLGSLASNSELIVMRAAGISLWRIVIWVMRPALILVLLSIMTVQWVLPYTKERAQLVKNPKAASSLGVVRGYWVREGQRFIYIDYANSAGKLSQVKVINFDENYRLKTLMKAQKGAFVKEGEWQLNSSHQLSILDSGAARLQAIPQEALSLALQPKFVHMVTQDPEDLAPTELVGFMRYMQQYSQVPKTYQLAFWKIIGAPFSLLALTLIACSFVFGPLRQQSMGFRLVVALFVGLGVYYLQDFASYASLVYSPSPAWFVFVPIALMYIVGGYLLYRAR